MWRHSSNANEVCDLAIVFGAHSAHDDDLLRAFEGAVFTAIFDQPRGERGADSGKPHELFCGGRVDVNTIILGESGGLHHKKHKKDRKKHKKGNLCFL